MALKTCVLFNEPVELDIPGKVPVGRGVGLTQLELLAYVNECKLRGFAENTIVVSRTQSLYMRRRCENWGIIRRVFTYRPMEFAGNWWPYEVLWFSDGNRTNHWDDELLQVHGFETDTELDARFKLQEAL